MSNYRFTKGNEGNSIVLRDHHVVVTKDNLTDQLAEIILSMPGVSHNVELIPGRGPVIDEKKREDQTGEVKLPESIVSALKDAKIEKEVSKPQPKKKESPLPISKPSMEKSMPKKKGKK